MSSERPDPIFSITANDALAFMESVLTDGPVGYAFLDMDLCFLWVSERIAIINGIPISDHIGRTAQEIAGHERWPLVKPLLERARSGEPVLDAALSGLPSMSAGSSPRALVSYMPVRVGGVISGIGVAVRDVTEQQSAEAAATAAYLRYRFLADAMPQIVWTATPEGSVDYFNPQWYEYTRLTDRQSLDHGWETVVHPDDLSASVSAWRKAVATGDPYEVEYRLRRGSDGTYRWHLGRGVPMNDELGAVLLWVGTCTDIHDQRQAEDQRRAFLREMLASVTEGKLRLCDTPADLPAPFTAVAEPITLDTTQSLRVVRHLAQDTAQALEFPDIRWQHLITATSEMAMNAIQHAGGGIARVGINDNCTVQIWIEDRGGGITVQDLPRATLERGYSGAGTLGHGFWLTLQTADRVFLLTGPEGTTVVLEQDRAQLEPAWLR